MIVEIRCTKCGKLVAKREEKTNCKGIYFYCTRCKQNFEIEEKSALVADKK